MVAWTELFGAELATKDGNKPTEQVLAGKKVVGVYFSAHWCGPCRGFTPTLSATYDDLVEEHDDVEIVFVSYDRDASSFGEYYSEMPFKALPFENEQARGDLGTKYEARSIPTLVFLNGEGEIITKDGRGLVDAAKGDVEQLYTKLTTK